MCASKSVEQKEVIVKEKELCTCFDDSPWRKYLEESIVSRNKSKQDGGYGGQTVG